jgi:hypothetical protein
MAGSLVRARAVSLLLVCVAVAAGWSSSSLAGTRASADAGPPWADPAHQGRLELLAGRIVSTLAGRAVAVHCESPDSWQALGAELGFSADAELGYVPVSYDPLGQTVAADPTLIELAPQVCLSLYQFAFSDPKPTTCTVTVAKRHTVQVRRRVLVRERVKVNGRARVRAIWRVKLVRTTVTRLTTSPPRPCFAAGAPVSGMTNAFWSRYADDASAILVLAHEAVHLTQYRAGAPVPPRDSVEAEAQCTGMQWMHTVAVQLGDTRADAEAIAQYTYVGIYPDFRGTSYWSPECVQGGALDRRAAGRTSWP